MTGLLTKHGAASLLGITNRAVEKLVKEKKVPYVELPNGEIRFDRSDLSKWVDTLKGVNKANVTKKGE